MEFKTGPTEYRGDGLCRAGVGGLKAYLEYSGLLNDDAAALRLCFWLVCGQLEKISLSHLTFCRASLKFLRITSLEFRGQRFFSVVEVSLFF